MYDTKDYAMVRQDILEALLDYAQHHHPVGGFLQSVLENDLAWAIGRADPGNRAVLHYIVLFVCNELPSPCHGSPEKYAAWIGEKAPVTV